MFTQVIAKISVPEITRLTLALIRYWSVFSSPSSSVRKVFDAAEGGFGVWFSDNSCCLIFFSLTTNDWFFSEDGDVIGGRIPLVVAFDLHG